MSQFPKIPTVFEKNYVIGRDFDIMKRNSDKFEHKLLKYNNGDRFIASRHEIKTRFHNQNNEKEFNVLLSENNLNTMKKLMYQKEVKKVFNQENGRKEEQQQGNSKKSNSLIQLDWPCKLLNIREKFLPDFETLEKLGFGKINTYLWSSKHIIASASRSKISLYHPINGFTRALEVNRHKVAIIFSNSGSYLAMAYRKSDLGDNDHDLYVFHIHQAVLFTDERLETEKVRTNIENDITALCYSKKDTHLMCGTNMGEIFVIKQTTDPKKRNLYWAKMKKKLSDKHDHEIVKICFSATGKYMASLDIKGIFKIWNGGSWTLIFTYQSQEHPRLCKHFEWHPYVDNEFIYARQFYPSIYLFDVAQRKVVACFTNWNEDWELTSIAFNPKTAQLAVCFYNQEEYINRVSILASMSQVISSFDFDYIEGGLKLFWNSNGEMLGAGARSFRFAFWCFHKSNDFNIQLKEQSDTKNTKKSAKMLTLSDSKLSCLR